MGDIFTIRGRLGIAELFFKVAIKALCLTPTNNNAWTFHNSNKCVSYMDFRYDVWRIVRSLISASLVYICNNVGFKYYCWFIFRQRKKIKRHCLQNHESNSILRSDYYIYRANCSHRGPTKGRGFGSWLWRRRRSLFNQARSAKKNALRDNRRGDPFSCSGRIKYINTINVSLIYANEF